MVSEQDIQDIINNYGTFTKEEAEILNNYEVKCRAKYNYYKYSMLANTSPGYFQRNVIISKFGRLMFEHKQLILQTTLEHIQIHKEILLQCLSIMQSLVNNPNLLDTLVSLLNSNWYGNQDFKQFLCGIINNELQSINTLYTQQLILTTKPLCCFLPELFEAQGTSIDTIDIGSFYSTLDEKYIIEP